MIVSPFGFAVELREQENRRAELSRSVLNAREQPATCSC